jgi:hypothetical protein
MVPPLLSWAAGDETQAVGGARRSRQRERGPIQREDDMTRAIMAVIGTMAALALTNAAAVAQTAPQAGQQTAPNARVRPYFVDANGDAICDNAGAWGAQRGRGMGRGAWAGFGRGMRAGAGRGFGAGFGAGLASGPNGESLVDLLAKVTGKDRAAVLGELATGKTPAQVAESNGKSAEELIEVVLSARREAVADAVAAGRMTQDQADQLMAQMKTHVQQQVAAPWQPRGRGFGGGRGPGWRVIR